MESDVSTIEQTVKELLESLGFSQVEIKAESGEEETTEVQIEVSPEDSGMLIGFPGETLSALQLVVGQMVFKKLGEWRRVVINIGDYREKRAKSLETMALNASERVRMTKQAIVLPYLTSSERRLIHVSLSSDPDVQTYSEGEGRRRRLVISPKEEKGKKEQEQKMDEKTNQS